MKETWFLSIFLPALDIVLLVRISDIIAKDFS
jgi:hypothetical protein